MDQSGFEPEFPPCEGGILAGLDDWPVKDLFFLLFKRKLIKNHENSPSEGEFSGCSETNSTLKSAIRFRHEEEKSIYFLFAARLFLAGLLV